MKKLAIISGVVLWWSVQCNAQTQGTLLWSFEGSNRMWCVSSIRDVNGNGIADVLVGVANDTLWCFEGSSQDTATIIWNFTSGNPWEHTFVDVDSIPDVNNDGIPDVITGCVEDTHALCLDGQNGNIIWRFSESVWSSTFVEPIGDVNNDGICDVILGLRQAHKIYCIDGSSIDSANVLWEFPVEGYLRWKYSISSLSDVDGDTAREVLVCVGHSKGKMDTQQESIVYCISGRTGDTIWIWDVPEPVAHCVSYIDDVNGNGIQDVLVGAQGPGKVYCLEGGNGNVIREYPCGNVVNVKGISDINGNGVSDALAGNGDDTLLCIEGNSDSIGNVLWIFPTSGGPGSPDHLNQISDVDGDSIYDILTGTWDGVIYCVSGSTGNLIWWFSEDTSAYASVMGMTGISDVNGNSIDDVVAVTYNRWVWCLSGKSYGVEESGKLKVRSEKLDVRPNPFVRFTEVRRQTTEFRYMIWQVD